MINAPEISIIIPVYNRATLLPETLDSIIAQTFTSWECILVDDVSEDTSFEVMELYAKKDSRFKVYKRPVHLKKGANACRNYGFLKSNGQYIKWFDSDDIMLPEHLEISYNAIITKSLDFVVTDTVNFSHENGMLLGKPYEFDRNMAIISSMNFAQNKMGWITDDFLGTRQIVENVKFNELIITDGDEYNFFVKLLKQPFKGRLLEDVLTHRRVHSNSLTKMNDESSNLFLAKIANIKYLTAQDLVVYQDKELIQWFLIGYMRNSYELAISKQKVLFKNHAFMLICKYFTIFKGFVFLLALFMAWYFNRGYNIMKYARS
ncbi:glycosyltransferase family 2 protein [Aestuariibaculum sp. YM273]|uniref:glycosyltransferase family 2 protein n=1 Tax=Aestuariibaculum sp. YM273 TaxID=3070659 RepID=UPI0027DBFC37|nr:glycosyltransferase family 2 protein [Aestuariibaculum sp. YM273]WMI65823.1 glycosyltransferase family 2 protein [Aestuariibaculum sp. YM273]